MLYGKPFSPHFMLFKTSERKHTQSSFPEMLLSSSLVPVCQKFHPFQPEVLVNFLWNLRVPQVNLSIFFVLTLNGSVPYREITGFS